MDHHEDDNIWDYDCPQFVDFTAPMPFNDGADQMFGKPKLSSVVDPILTTKMSRRSTDIETQLPQLVTTVVVVGTE